MRPAPRRGGTTRFVSLSLTDEASCGLTAAGELFCWGSLGLFSGNSAVATTPVRLAPSLTFSAIASGSFHLCGLQGSGVAWCWGVNSAGQLGSGASEAIVSAPQRVAGDHVFRAPFAGLRRSCGITADDQAWCWGAPYAGDASASPRSVPVFVGTS